MPASTRRWSTVWCHGIAESAMFAPATLSRIPRPAASTSASSSTSAAPRRPAWSGGRRRPSSWGSATRCSPSCPVGAAARGPSAARPPTPDWYGASSNLLRLAAGRVRDPVRQPRPERAVRPDRPALRAREFGYDPSALAKIAVDQRTNACAHPGRGVPRHADHDRRRAGQPDDRRPDPHAGDRDARARGRRRGDRQRRLARRGRHRPVWIKGFGEHIAFKTPTYAADLLHTPIARAADRAFAMAGLDPADVDVASIYDCYTITVLMSLEDAGFCAKGKGMAFVDRPRPDLPRRLPAQHRRWSIVVRAGRHGRRNAPRRRRRPPDHGPRRRRAGRRLQHRVRHRQRRHHERAGRALLQGD